MTETFKCNEDGSVTVNGVYLAGLIECADTLDILLELGLKQTPIWRQAVRKMMEE